MSRHEIRNIKTCVEKGRCCYHNKEARVGVDHLGLVSGLQIPEDGSIVKEGQVDHVLTLLKLVNNMCDKQATIRRI